MNYFAYRDMVANNRGIPDDDVRRKFNNTDRRANKMFLELLFLVAPKRPKAKPEPEPNLLVGQGMKVNCSICGILLDRSVAVLYCALIILELFSSERLPLCRAFLFFYFYYCHK
jgi:hypothetical protein